MDYFCETDKKYGTPKLRVPTVVQPQLDHDAAAPALTTFGELMECLNIVPSIPQMLQRTSRPGSSHNRLGSGKPQWAMSLRGLAPAVEHDSSLIQNAKLVELICIDRCR